MPPTTHERRSLQLSPDEWRELEDWAAVFDCRPSQGSQIEKTSWRTLIKQIARGDIHLDTTPLNYVEPPSP